MLSPEAHQQLQAKITAEGLTAENSALWQHYVDTYYRTRGRDFPWRRTRDPYHIFVSEIMLQQTQTDRVVSKFTAFIQKFPDFQILARSPLPEILTVWQGLGYNRRALALKKSAQLILDQHGGCLPSEPDFLRKLPGIGPATAASICVFAFNKPLVFIETNIRTVFIYFFFAEATQVSDHQIMPLIERLLDRDNPYQWYSALMDVGVFLKKNIRGVNQKSVHYAPQSPFKGSNRRIRGLILKVLLQQEKIREQALIKTVGENPERVSTIICQLQAEGFLERQGVWCRIRNNPEAGS